MSDEKLQNENLQEEIVESEVKEETTVAEENEVKDEDVKPEETAEETPEKEEAPAEDEGEKVEEENKEEKEEVEEEKEETDTTPSEETSEQTEEKPEEKTEEDSDVPPPTEEEEATEEESAEDVEKVKAELEALREAEEERKGLEDLGNLVQNVETEYNRVLNGIQKALNDTLDQYGIDKTKTLDELRKEDPAKAVIAEDLIRQANEVKQFNETNLTKQVQDKGAELVFKKAEKLFNKYTLSHEQAEVAADTFINIMMNVGVNDLGEDLAAKVELAAARAKLVIPDAVSEAEVKDEAPVETVEDVVDVPAAEDTAEEPKEEKTDKPEEKPEEEEQKPEVKVTVEKPSIDSLKEGVADGDSGAANSNPITADNVLEVMASVPFKNRVQFYKDHEDLINEAARRRSK